MCVCMNVHYVKVCHLDLGCEAKKCLSVGLLKNLPQFIFV